MNAWPEIFCRHSPKLMSIFLKLVAAFDFILRQSKDNSCNTISPAEHSSIHLRHPACGFIAYRTIPPRMISNNYLAFDDNTDNSLSITLSRGDTHPLHFRHHHTALQLSLGTLFHLPPSSTSGPSHTLGRPLRPHQPRTGQPLIFADHVDHPPVRLSVEEESAVSSAHRSWQIAKGAEHRRQFAKLKRRARPSSSMPLPFVSTIYRANKAELSLWANIGRGRRWLAYLLPSGTGPCN